MGLRVQAQGLGFGMLGLEVWSLGIRVFRKDVEVFECDRLSKV